MELRTSRFGELDISEEDIYRFPKGLPGFEENTTFVIISPEEDEPFSFLQSVTNEKLVFVLADPFLFYADYDFEIPDSALVELGITSEAEVLIRSIISVQEQLDEATINLVAPLIFNSNKNLGKQIVLGKTNYMTKHTLFSTAGNR